jgi:hypothetical protein
MKECERPARELLGGVQLRGLFVERHQARAARHKTPGTPPMGLGLVLPGERLVLGWHTLQDKTDGGGERKSGVYGWKGTSDGEACGILDGSRMWFSYLVWCRSSP